MCNIYKSTSDTQFYTYNSDRQAWANSGDPDQTPHNAAFSQGLHCFSLMQQVSRRIERWSRGLVQSLGEVWSDIKMFENFAYTAIMYYYIKITINAIYNLQIVEKNCQLQKCKLYIL